MQQITKPPCNGLPFHPIPLQMFSIDLSASTLIPLLTTSQSSQHFAVFCFPRLSHLQACRHPGFNGFHPLPLSLLFLYSVLQMRHFTCLVIGIRLLGLRICFPPTGHLPASLLGQEKQTADRTQPPADTGIKQGWWHVCKWLFQSLDGWMKNYGASLMAHRNPFSLQ